MTELGYPRAEIDAMRDRLKGAGQAVDDVRDEVEWHHSLYALLGCSGRGDGKRLR